MLEPPIDRSVEALLTAAADDPHGADDVAARAVLPLDARAEPAGEGWSARIVLHAEHVVVQKQVVVTEQVAVRVRSVQEVVPFAETVHREQVRVALDGALADEELPTASAGAAVASEISPTVVRVRPAAHA